MHKLALTLAAATLSLMVGCVFSPKETCSKGTTCGTGGNGANGGTGGTGNTGNSPPVNCDKDGDGHKAATSECGGDDCDDSDPNVHPGAVEICGNGVDDNCNEQIDEGCACSPGDSQDCYSGPADTENVGQCHAGVQACSNGSVWGPCQLQHLPEAEVCSNGIDDDCDGSVDEGCTVTDCDKDGDGHNAEGCHDDSGRPEDDCDDNNAARYPGATEICGDGIDQDCDDSDLPCGSGGDVTICLHYQKLPEYTFEHVRTSYWLPNANEMIVDMGFKQNSQVEYVGVMVVPTGMEVTIAAIGQINGGGALYPFDVCSYPGYFCPLSRSCNQNVPNDCVGMTVSDGAFCDTTVGHYWVTKGNCETNGSIIWDSDRTRPQTAAQDTSNDDWQDNPDGLGLCTANGTFVAQ